MPAIWIPKRLVDVSLVNVAAESPCRFVERCETLYENRVFSAAAEVMAAGRPVVMLAGPSASGKTTTAHKLAKALTLRGARCQVVSLDNFYLNKDKYPRLPDGSKDYENIDALDIACIKRCLDELVRQGWTELPLFDFKTESRQTETQRLDRQGGMILVEGIHALNPILTEGLMPGSAFRVYAGLREEYSDAEGMRFIKTREVRLARRMTRDVTFRGHSLEKTMRLWDRVCDGENRYIKVFKKEADLLMDTSFSYEPCVLAGQIAPLAGLLPPESPVSETLNDLAGRFSRFAQLPLEAIPASSMLQEFYAQGG